MADFDVSWKITVDGAGKAVMEVERVERAADGASKSAFSMSKAFAAASAALAAVGVVQFGREATDASNQIERLVGTLRVANRELGDSGAIGRAAADDLAFIRSTANDLGLEFERLAPAMADVIKNAAGSGIDIRAVLESVGEAATVTNRSAEDVEGALAQMSQGIARGKFELEDLKIIAERGIGSFDLFAKAVGLSGEEFLDAVSKGQVLAKDFLPALAAELKRTFGPEVAAAADNTLSNMFRVKNAIFELKVAAGEGLSPAIREASKALTDLGSNQQALQLFRDIGAGIGTVITALVAVVKNYGQAKAAALQFAADALRSASDVRKSIVEWRADVLALAAGWTQAAAGALEFFGVVTRNPALGEAANKAALAAEALRALEAAARSSGEETARGWAATADALEDLAQEALKGKAPLDALGRAVDDTADKVLTLSKAGKQSEAELEKARKATEKAAEAERRRGEALLKAAEQDALAQRTRDEALAAIYESLDAQDDELQALKEGGKAYREYEIRIEATAAALRVYAAAIKAGASDTEAEALANRARAQVLDRAAFEDASEGARRWGEALSDSMQGVSDILRQTDSDLGQLASAFLDVADAAKRYGEAVAAGNEEAAAAASGEIGGLIAAGFGALLGGGGTSQFGGRREGSLAGLGSSIGNEFGGTFGAIVGGIVGSLFKTGADDLRVTLESTADGLKGVILEAQGELADLAPQIVDALEGFFSAVEDLIGQSLSADGFSIHIREDNVTVAVNGLTQVFQDLDAALAWAAGQVLSDVELSEDVGDNVRRMFENLSGLDGAGSLEELAAGLDLATLLDTGLGPSYRALSQEFRANMDVARQFKLDLADVVDLLKERIRLEREAIDSQRAGLIGVSATAQGVRDLVATMQALQSQVEDQRAANRRRVEEIDAEIAAIEAANVATTGSTEITMESVARMRQSAREAGQSFDDFTAGLDDTARAAVRSIADLAQLREEAAALGEELPDAFSLQDIIDTWQAGAAVIGQSLIDLVQSYRGEGALAAEERELQALQFRLQLAEQVRQIELFLSWAEQLPAATRAILERARDAALELLSDPNLSAPTAPSSGRSSGNRRASRQALLDELAELERGFVGTAATIARAREETAEWVHEARRLGQVSEEQIATYQRLRAEQEALVASASASDILLQLARVAGDQEAIAEGERALSLLRIANLRLEAQQLFAIGAISQEVFDGIVAMADRASDAVLNPPEPPPPPPPPPEDVAAERRAVRERVRAYMDDAVSSSLASFREYRRALGEARREVKESTLTEQERAAALAEINAAELRARQETYIGIIREIVALGAELDPSIVEAMARAEFELAKARILATLADAEAIQILQSFGIVAADLAGIVAGLEFTPGGAAGGGKPGLADLRVVPGRSGKTTAGGGEPQSVAETVDDILGPLRERQLSELARINQEFDGVIDRLRVIRASQADIAEAEQLRLAAISEVISDQRSGLRSLLEEIRGPASGTRPALIAAREAFREAQAAFGLDSTDPEAARRLEETARAFFAASQGFGFGATADAERILEPFLASVTDADAIAQAAAEAAAESRHAAAQDVRQAQLLALHEMTSQIAALPGFFSNALQQLGDRIAERNMWN